MCLNFCLGSMRRYHFILCARARQCVLATLGCDLGAPSRRSRWRPEGVLEGGSCGPGLGDYTFCVFLFFSRKRENVYSPHSDAYRGGQVWPWDKGLRFFRFFVFFARTRKSLLVLAGCLPGDPIGAPRRGANVALLYAFTLSGCAPRRPPPRPRRATRSQNSDWSTLT